MSNQEKYSAQFDDLVRKIDVRLRNESYKNPDVAYKTITDSKTLLTSAKKLIDDMERDSMNVTGDQRNTYQQKVIAYFI